MRGAMLHQASYYPTTMSTPIANDRGRGFVATTCLRVHQKKCVDEPRVDKLISLPCGAGKTAAALHEAARNSKDSSRPTLIVCKSRECKAHWDNEIRKHTDVSALDVGYIDPSIDHHVLIDSNVRIWVVMIQSLTTFDGKNGCFDAVRRCPMRTIVVDEVHNMAAPTFRRIFELKADHWVGLTATPVRSDGEFAMITQRFGDPICPITWKQMEEQRMMPRLSFERCVFSASEYMRTFDVNDSIVKKFNPRKLCAIGCYLNIWKDDHVLIMCDCIELLKVLSKLHNVRYVTGENCPLSQQVLQDFREGRIKRLLLSRVGDEALDLPVANRLLQVDSLGATPTQFVQRAGRVARFYPGKENATIVDMVDSEDDDEAFNTRFHIFQAEEYKCDQVDVPLDSKEVEQMEQRVRNYFGSRSAVQKEAAEIKSSVQKKRSTLAPRLKATCKKDSAFVKEWNRRATKLNKNKASHDKELMQQSRQMLTDGF